MELWSLMFHNMAKTCLTMREIIHLCMHMGPSNTKNCTPTRHNFLSSFKNQKWLQAAVTAATIAIAAVTATAAVVVVMIIGELLRMRITAWEELHHRVSLLTVLRSSHQADTMSMLLMASKNLKYIIEQITLLGARWNRNRGMFLQQSVTSCRTSRKLLEGSTCLW